MLISIDICDDTVFITEGTVSSGNIDLHICDAFKLPEGTVEDGDIKNHSALVTSVSRLLNAHRFKSSGAVATFTSSAVISRRLKLPPGKPSETAGMVKNQMSQAVGDPADYVFEFTFAAPGQTKDAAGDIWAYALDKELIERYYALLKSLRLRPLALDIHSNGIAKLLAGARVNGQSLDGRSTLFVDVERDYLEIHLFCGDERAFSRTAPVSARDFIMIASNLGYGARGSDSGIGAVPPLAGQPSQSGALPDLSPARLAADPVLADAARQYAGLVCDELSKMIQFQLMRDSSLPVSNVYLFGGVSATPGLCESFAQSLPCPVEPVRDISKLRGAQPEQIQKYLNAVGALIRLK